MGEERDYIYLPLHCHHQNDFCIKMGSDENHFNVSVIVRDKVTRQCPQTATFEEKGEPKRIRTEHCYSACLLFTLSVPSVSQANSKHWFTTLLPPTTAIIGYAIGLEKLSVNKRYFIGAEMAGSL